MEAREWMYLIAASGHLALGALALLRGRTSAVAKPLALLCGAMFGFCFASLAAGLTGNDAWRAADSVFTALAPAPVLHLVVVFVGARHAHARAVAAVYVAFGALAASSVALGRPWAASAGWGYVFLALWAPAAAFTAFLLLRHLVRETEPDEKARTRTILAALVVGGALATVDLVDAAGFPMPHLAPLGTLLATLLIATAVFRFRLFDRDLSIQGALYAGALALAAVIAYLGAFRLLGGNLAGLVFATVVVTLALGAAVHELATSLATSRARTERLSTLGRFSSQLAHDLKNPLATLRGALQFLDEERKRGRSLDAQHEFVPLMLDQVERLSRIVDDYERVGRVEPVRRPSDVNDIVRGVVALEPFAAKDGVSMRAELAPELPMCEVDPDLVKGALENVIKNAFEAMPAEGGAITVRTARAGEGVEISVEDVGCGMDARAADRAFDDFFTTKASGSGLGLAFVRRVAQAHGGDVSLVTRRGAGTTVKVRLAPRVRG
jgi:signal transduction histidine kinase